MCFFLWSSNKFNIFIAISVVSKLKSFQWLWITIKFTGECNDTYVESGTSSYYDEIWLLSQSVDLGQLFELTVIQWNIDFEGHHEEDNPTTQTEEVVKKVSRWRTVVKIVLC